MRVSEILRLSGFPENPIGILTGLTKDLSGSPKDKRAKLVMLQMILQDPDFATHPKAWEDFLAAGTLPPTLLPKAPSIQTGWPIPIFLEELAQGGVAHVEFERPGLSFRGHVLDLSGPMETLLECFSKIGEKALPDPHLRPYAARIRPVVRLDGRSWELPCLIGYFAEHSGRKIEPVFASAAVECDGRLTPGDRLKEKLHGWIREVGSGGTAVLLEGQKDALVKVERAFERIEVLGDLTDLRRFLGDRGWLAPHQETPDRVSAERRLRVSENWYREGKPRLALLTLESLKDHRQVLSPRQEALWLRQMHYVLSCFGRFREGMDYLTKIKQKLKDDRDIFSLDEKAIHAAKAAVQLYDAHRFKEAERLLSPFLGDRRAVRGISQISRAKLLGSMGQVLTAMEKWEEARSKLGQALEIFKRLDPLEVSRCYHYLIHNRLRAGDLDGADRLLDESRNWLEKADLYGALFRSFYETDLARRKGLSCGRPALPKDYAGLVHPYCFALQAWARNPKHTLHERISAVREAAELLQATKVQDGVLAFLACTYTLYESLLAGDENLSRIAWKNWRTWVTKRGGRPFRERYKELLLKEPEGHSSMEAFLDRIPYH